ncbi:uncharacterized protein DNG_00303 [Cephalotrichum gorgonifer]|uniref:Uncharacterized protein n=1 Tax=Cephalotrichum gorgonifer TaxID=2041049 RepID=A0AAE8SQM0_9PEZI|nr:uncharacterized protein DNG_00303 [Cephalotrichum gorgonifer]
MSALHSGAATLPRGFRYHAGDSEPRTPEPFATVEDETHPPSPPRPKFRIKRRHASQLAAPTQQFLASVAAADVPVPSIEVAEPETDSLGLMQGSQFPRVPQIQVDNGVLVCHKVRRTPLLPPKTPEPEAGHVPSVRHYPDWTIDSTFSSDDSSPECEYSRPSTARSTHTSASLFSRMSFTSEDAQCMSPEFDGRDACFQALDYSKDRVRAASAEAKSKGKLRKAPWTRAMSEHLWSTYLMYCQDPKVTPFRTGRNGIPPHGVCIRVAREAKRSWRGSRAHLAVADKSGSSTPTAESSSAYIQWPHTSAATRARLLELSRMKSASSAARTHQYLSHSPTPFGKTATRQWNRRTTPLRSPSIFSSRDLNITLGVCTAESLQPTGPLAQLTSAALDSSALEGSDGPSSGGDLAVPDLELGVPENRRFRLRSPFTTRSYGPSSSSSLGAAFSPRTTVPERQTSTLEPRRSLQSPAHLTRSRSNTLQQKRRSRQISGEVRRYKRPSLGSDLWTEPFTPVASKSSIDESSTTTTRPSLEFSSTSSRHHDDLFVPRTNLEDIFTTTQPATEQPTGAPPPPFTLSSLALPANQPPRLGSPFAATNSSLSFPNRLSQPTNLFGPIRRPFATIQQPAADDTDATARANLASRLTYINDRLQEFRRRDHQRRRSESPL